MLSEEERAEQKSEGHTMKQEFTKQILSYYL